MTGSQEESAERLRDLAATYKETAARLAVRVRELKAMGADRYRINHINELLSETRQIARTLSHYYDTPRDPAVTGAGYHARKGKNRDD